MTAAIRIMALQIGAASNTGARHGATWRFLIRLRNRLPIVFALWRSTWEEWAQ